MKARYNVINSLLGGEEAVAEVLQFESSNLKPVAPTSEQPPKTPEVPELEA